MKKIVALTFLIFLIAGCSTSPYVGNWQAPSADGKTTYDLTLNEDGSVVAKWHNGVEYVTKTGTWEDAGDGSISLDGYNSFATAKLEKNKLILMTQKKLRLHMTRQAIRHANNPR